MPLAVIVSWVQASPCCQSLTRFIEMALIAKAAHKPFYAVAERFSLFHLNDIITSVLNNQQLQISSVIPIIPR